MKEFQSRHAFLSERKKKSYNNNLLCFASLSIALTLRLKARERYIYACDDLTNWYNYVNEIKLTHILRQSDFAVMIYLTPHGS